MHIFMKMFHPNVTYISGIQAKISNKGQLLARTKEGKWVELGQYVKEADDEPGYFPFIRCADMTLEVKNV